MVTTHAEPDRRLEIHNGVVRLFSLVREGLATATAAFLAGDREAARQLVAGDPLIDALQSSVEELVQLELDTLEASSHDVRLLVSVLLLVPELERSGDLVEHIALRTQRGLVAMLTPSARGLIREMGELGVAMWAGAAEAWVAQEPGAAVRLREMDDRLDDLHVRLTAELATSGMPTAAAIEMGLVARFFERLGDHAVNVARRVGYVTSGTP